jgi:hypothetical protein
MWVSAYSPVFNPQRVPGRAWAVCYLYRGGQNNGNTKKLNRIFLSATLKELQLTTLNVLLPFVYTL